MGIPQQQMMGIPQQQMMGIPQQQMMGIPQQQMMGIPQQQMMGIPQQQMMGLPQQQMMGIPQQQMMGMPPERGKNSTFLPYFSINFYVKIKVNDLKEDEYHLIIQGNNNMSIKHLIRGFKVLLCDDTMQIDKYILEPTNIELDPNSTETIFSQGINESTNIIVMARKYNKE